MNWGMAEQGVTRLLTAIIATAVYEAEKLGPAHAVTRRAARDFLHDPIAAEIAAYVGVPGKLFHKRVRSCANTKRKPRSFMRQKATEGRRDGNV